MGAWAQRGPCIPHPPAESERFYLKIKMSFQLSTPAPNQPGPPFPALPSPVSLLTLNPATAPDCKSDSMLPGSR